MNRFSIDADAQFAPIPPFEQSLPTITAEPWFKVSDDNIQLEGLCFDRDGNLFFLEVFGGTLFKLNIATMQLNEIYRAQGENPAAIKIHKDGRLFVCCLGDFEKGHIFSINPDGSDRRTVIEGHVADDMIFAADGSFYFTHFVGSLSRPTGGVFHVSADYQTITPILENMAGPNGVALSTNERILWVTETNANRLHLVELNEDRTTIAHYGTCIPYRFTGFLGPDSCSIDDQDNLYVAMYSQGRVMVFNPNGFPLGQVLLPGREHGLNLKSTHPMIIPETDDLLICTNDAPGNHGSWIFKAKAIGFAHNTFQFHD